MALALLDFTTVRPFQKAYKLDYLDKSTDLRGFQFGLWNICGMTFIAFNTIGSLKTNSVNNFKFRLLFIRQTEKHEPLTAPTQEAGLRPPQTVLW